MDRLLFESKPILSATLGIFGKKVDYNDENVITFTKDVLSFVSEIMFDISYL